MSDERLAQGVSGGATPTMWVCRAEGEIDREGRRGNVDAAISEHQLSFASSQGVRDAMRRDLERRVLVGYFSAYGRVPYCVVWFCNGREWLEPVARDCCWVEEGSAGAAGLEDVDMWAEMRDTRDLTVTNRMARAARISDRLGP